MDHEGCSQVFEPNVGVNAGQGLVKHVLASWALPLADALRDCGEDSHLLFKQVRIDIEAAKVPGSTIPSRSLDEAWELATVVTGDRLIGLKIAPHVRASTFDAVGYAIYASVTLGDSIERIRNYFRILSGAATIRICRQNDALELHLMPNYDGGSAARAVGLSAALVKIWRDMYRLDFAPAGLRLFAPAGGYTKDEQVRLEAHFGCAVDSSSGGIAIAITHKDSIARLRAANAGLAERLDGIAWDFAQHLQGNTLADRVMLEAVQHFPSGKTTLNDIAYELNMAPRTLQRRLVEEGASFQNVVDTARRRLADAYLKAGDKTPKMMAYLLGFSDVSHFSRAVKGWFGRTPGELIHSRL